MTKGVELEEAGSFREAMVYWELATDKSEDPSPMLLTRLARAAWEAGDFDRAEKAYLSAIDKAPDDEPP